MFNIYGSHFYGNKISDYGIENGYVDYATLAKAFDAVLSNNIISDTYEIGYWDQISGFVDHSDEIAELEEKIDELETQLQDDPDNGGIKAEISELETEKDDLEYYENYYPEIYQYYIVSDPGAEILEECNEIVFYNDTLDLYVWGVTHYGTSWDYVLTDIPCNTGKI